MRERDANSRRTELYHMGLITGQKGMPEFDQRSAIYTNTNLCHRGLIKRDARNRRKFKEFETVSHRAGYLGKKMPEFVKRNANFRLTNLYCMGLDFLREQNAKIG